MTGWPGPSTVRANGVRSRQSCAEPSSDPRSMHEHPSDSPIDWTTLRQLVARFDDDPDWLPAAAESITDAIHAEILSGDDLGLRPATRASTDGVLRAMVAMILSDQLPQDV